MRSDFLWLTRVCVLGVVLFLSFVTLALSANYIAKYQSFNVPGLLSLSTPGWTGLALAISIITLITLGPMLIIDLLRSGAMSSWILIEVIVVGVLSILWLATGADAAAYTDGVVPNCSVFDDTNVDVGLVSVNLGVLGTLCRSYQAIEAFAFLNWLLLMGYAITLVVLTFMSSNRGNSGVWKSSVRQTDFMGGSPGATNYSMKQQNYNTAIGPQGYNASV